MKETVLAFTILNAVDYMYKVYLIFYIHVQVLQACCFFLTDYSILLIYTNLKIYAILTL